MATAQLGQSGFRQRSACSDAAAAVTDNHRASLLPYRSGSGASDGSTEPCPGKVVAGPPQPINPLFLRMNQRLLILDSSSLGPVSGLVQVVHGENPRTQRARRRAWGDAVHSPGQAGDAPRETDLTQKDILKRKLKLSRIAY